MKIFLFSGSGFGSGKSTACRKLTQDTWSIANAIRDELTYKYPNYNFYNKSQEYKANTIIQEWGEGRSSVRDVMIAYGEAPCKTNPTYWADKLVSYLKNRHFIADGTSIIGVDDVRKLCEVSTIREAFPTPGQVTHFHVISPNGVGTPEPQFENDKLAAIADYTLNWINK